MRLRVLAAVLLAGWLAGCGELLPSPDGGQFVGLSYTGTEVTGPDGAPLPAEAAGLSLAFAANGITASAGCNTITGSGGIREGVLVLQDVLMTEIGCDPALQAQEQWWAQFLTGAPRAQLGDRQLTLDDGRVTVTLVSPPGLPDLPLAGTPWRAVAVSAGGGADGSVTTVPEDSPITLLVTDGTLALTGWGCQPVTVPVVDEGTSLVYDPAGFASCPGADVFAAGTVDYAITGDLLRITGPGGQRIDFRS